MAQSAGRANTNVTAITRIFGGIARAVIVLFATVSVHTIIAAENWIFELGRQVACWTGIVAGGSLTIAIGTVFTPPGAALTGLAVGMIGSLVAEQLYTVVAACLSGISMGADSQPTLLVSIKIVA